MKFQFVSLRFDADPNINDKSYWYVSEICLKPGDKVLAPIGIHDKLQAATVEEVVLREPEEAPYDIRLVKCVMSRYGVRSLEIDAVPLIEFGGARYDEKHFTPFGRVLYAKERPVFSEGFRFYGVVLFISEEEEHPFELIEAAHGCVLLYGNRGAKVYNALLNLLKGQKDPLFEGVDEAVLTRLREKLK